MCGKLVSCLGDASSCAPALERRVTLEEFGGSESAADIGLRSLCAPWTEFRDSVLLYPSPDYPTSFR